MSPHRHLHINDSGWRDVIADGFTIERLSAVVKALAQARPRQKALIGSDNRFLSPELARHIACVLDEAGWSTEVLSEIFPTPGVAHLAQQRGFDFGLVVTASHNPYFYNGLKILDSHGALIDRNFADTLEARANALLEKQDKSPTFDLHRRSKQIAEGAKARKDYLDAILQRVDVKKIRAAKLKVAWDAFGGTDAQLFPDFLERLGVAGESVTVPEGPTYGGRRMEPDETSLKELEALVIRTRSSVGLATDVDGDRFSAVDETGAYVLNNALASLMVWYLLEDRGERGTVYQTVSSSLLTQRICQAYGVPLVEVPVGFIKMGRLMVGDKSPLIGVEETGGLAYAPHLPFKDGLMAHALVLEMLARRGETLSGNIEALHKKFGRVHYRRVDLHLPSEAEVDRWTEGTFWERALGESIQGVSHLDGVKWTFPGGSWLLIRRSKTEPLLRIYCESEKMDFTERVEQTTRGKKE